MRHPNVRNADEVEVREMIKGRHNMRLRQLGKPAGSIALGATLTEVAPGGISFPRHAHYVNEEAIYVLSGSGEARIGDTRVPVRPGDWIALPTGPEHAHQMVNASAAEPLVYLCISTMHGRRLSSIPIPARSAPASPIRQARSASAALACFGRQRHARLLGERARGGLSLVEPGHSFPRRHVHDMMFHTISETGGPSSRPELCTDAPGFDRRAFHQQYDAERSASSDIADTAPKPLGPERLAA